MAHLTGTALTQAEIDSWFTSGTYTPTLTNLAIGTGGTPTNTASYTFAGFPTGGVLTVEGKIKFGTTAPTLPGASNETISLPAGYSMISVDAARECGVAVFNDVTGSSWRGQVLPLTSTTVLLFGWSVSGTGLIASVITATVPFTWAVNDEIYYSFSVRCTGP